MPIYKKNLLSFLLSTNVLYMRKLCVHVEEAESNGIWDLSVKSFTYASDGHGLQPCGEMAKLSAFYY